MRKLKIFIISLLCLVMIYGGVRFSQAVAYTKPTYTKQHWDVVLNATIDAIAVDVTALYASATALSTLVTNWVQEDYQDILIPGCVYADADTSTAPGDLTVKFPVNAPVRARQADNTYLGSTVASSSYGGGNTTVNLNGAVLPNPLKGIWVSALRDGLWPYGPGWVIAADYGSNQAALEAADAVAFAAGKLLVVGQQYSITTDCNLTAAIKAMPVSGGTFTVSTTKTLTINGPFEAGLYQAFSLTGTAEVVFGSGAVKDVSPEWFYSGTGYWASAFQAAVNSLTVGNIRMVSNSYDLGTTIVNWKEKVNLLGNGVGQTTITSSATGYAISWTCANGTTEREAPRFADFTLTANSGIRLNNPANGFTDDATTQEYIMRPAFKRIKFIAAVPNSGIGLQASKCFPLLITECEFFRFGKNIDWHGNDGPILWHTRVIGGNNGLCSNAEAGTYNYTTFGNRQLIGGSCEFNVLNAGVGNDFIKTGARDITIADNYFEQGDAINSIVKVLDGCFTIRLTNNHFGVPSSATAHSIDFTAMADIPQNTMVAGNFGYANLMDAVGFPAAGVKYHYNSILPRQIYHAGNDVQLDSGNIWPFNSDWSGKYTGSEVAVFSPNHIGLRTVAGSYYETVKCFSGRFRLPTLTSADFLAFSLAGLSKTIDGTVSVRVTARTATAGQQYKVSYYNGAGPIDIQTKTPTNANQDYCLAVWSGVAVADMSIRIWNEDAVHGGYVDVERIIVTYG